MRSANVWALSLLLASVSACSLPRSVLVGPTTDMDARIRDAGPDGGRDAFMDDATMDAGMDSGSDGGSDGGADGGSDGGVDAFMADAWAPDPIGRACTTSATCASGFCVDGVCCESACDGACESCTLAADGICAAAAAGSDPDDECDVSAASTCGSIGVCDGARACTLHGNTVVCAAATCTGSTQTNPRVCNGAGACTSQGTTDCAPFACDGTVCFGSCASDADCEPSLYCVVSTGDCEPRLSNGQICTANNQCALDHCVDGVCCDTACGGTCEACLGSLTGGVNGTCAPVTAMTDPGSDCATMSTASCGTTGLCNGAGACARWPAGTECASASCAGGTGTLADACDGAGVCVDGGSTLCGAYVCGATACLTSCGGPGDCVSGRYCDAGTCALLRSNGQRCVGGGQCTSGHCVDGVCCNSDCVGTCSACTAALRGSGSDGACGLITAGTDPEMECAMQPAASCGTTGSCSGVGTCALYPLGAACGGSSCSLGVETHPTTCDGSGTCFTAATTPCSPYVCEATTCRTSCTLDAHCIAGDFCNGTGMCVARLGNGVSCSGDNQCTSAHCIDSVCCASATCSGTCQSCAVPTFLGTCTSVPSGSVDVGTCIAPNACDGAGMCLGTAGAVCTLDTQCLSDHCIDGVCCNDATCTGNCRSCAVAGSAGTCSFIPNGTDPDDDCIGAFECNGAGGCL